MCKRVFAQSSARLALSKILPFECGHTGVYKAEYHASSWRHFERVHGIRGKEVTLQRDGVTSDAFRYLDVDSTYFQLSVGDNLYRYSAEENLENLEVSIYHDDLYLGV